MTAARREEGAKGGRRGVADTEPSAAAPRNQKEPDPGNRAADKAKEEGETKCPPDDCASKTGTARLRIGRAKSSDVLRKVENEAGGAEAKTNKGRPTRDLKGSAKWCLRIQPRHSHLGFVLIIGFTLFICSPHSPDPGSGSSASRIPLIRARVHWSPRICPIQARVDL
jgi:hypothetical protein